MMTRVQEITVCVQQTKSSWTVQAQRTRLFGEQASGESCICTGVVHPSPGAGKRRLNPSARGRVHYTGKLGVHLDTATVVASAVPSRWARCTRWLGTANATTPIRFLTVAVSRGAPNWHAAFRYLTLKEVGLGCAQFIQSGSNSVVECQLPKLDVAASNPVSRSTFQNALYLQQRTRRLLHLVQLGGGAGFEIAADQRFGAAGAEGDPGTVFTEILVPIEGDVLGHLLSRERRKTFADRKS